MMYTCDWSPVNGHSELGSIQTKGVTNNVIIVYISKSTIATLVDMMDGQRTVWGKILLPFEVCLTLPERHGEDYCLKALHHGAQGIT
jgi:hypothetical protein